MRSTLVITTLALVGGTAHPQRLPVAFASQRLAGLTRTVAPPDEAVDSGQAPVALLAGGVIGGAGGTAVAVAAHSSALLVVAEPALLPLGVHVANGRRGSYALDLVASGASLAILGLGSSAVGGTRNADRFWVGASVIQLLTVVAVERATAKRPARTE